MLLLVSIVQYFTTKKSEIFWYLSSGLTQVALVSKYFPRNSLKEPWEFGCIISMELEFFAKHVSYFQIYVSIIVIHTSVPRKIWLNCINIFHMSLCKLWGYPGWVLVFILMFLTNFFFFFKSCPSHTVWKKSVFRIFLVRIFPHLDWYGSEKLRIRTLFTQYPFQILTTSRR